MTTDKLDQIATRAGWATIPGAISFPAWWPSLEHASTIAAQLVPIVGLLIAVVNLALLIRKWRRGRAFCADENGAVSRLALAGIGAVLAIGIPFAMKWEGVVYEAHWDRFGKVYDICYGNTRIDGRPVRPGDTATAQQCADMIEAVYTQFYYDTMRAFPRLKEAPASVQAMATDLAYNNGVQKIVAAPTTSGALRRGDWLAFCNMLPAWSKSDGEWVRGLFNRRVSSKEVCLSGLK